MGTLELELACAASLRAPPALLAQTPRASLRRSGPPVEDHSGSTLSWCRSRARVHSGPRVNPIADEDGGLSRREGELEQGGSFSLLQGSTSASPDFPGLGAL